ncbi:MAG: DUF1926 domain-containing protein [Candidatus Schekmanbacteria bacterium]|nr:DUF1926 domain-containing protein [Candidatus Schekmanbacteria bacterium]
MISLALAIHNHQPVGNFEHILEQAYHQAYSPFIEILERFPNIKLTLHYSGILWEYFLRAHPEFIAKIRGLAERGQIEIMSGGFYEPIMAILPDADKRGQIEKMNRFIKDQFGVEPKGFWLAERVWEPHLVKSLADCGLEYVVVDDSHFHEVGLEGDDLFGYYLSEENGATIKVFPGSMRLRYLIPFHPPEETIQYLQSLKQSGRSNLIVQMGDDGEKFGVWPHTYHTVYTERWLERFFQMLQDNMQWLKISTYSELITAHKPLGNVYLPTASYSEMMEWALPTPRRRAFEEAKHAAEHNPACQNCYRFLKGGFWRNFLVKYPESNQMHKKMLYLSQQLQDLNTRDKDTLALAQNELWQGQCNCAYWHGVFGGLYLPHLRKGIYDHLIKCGMLLDQMKHPKDSNWIDAESQDLLLNGTNSILINNSQLSLAVNADLGGALYSWDYKPAGLNFANNLTRRPETYHEKIKQLIAQSNQPKSGAQTIHEIQNLKDQDLDKYLSYDNYQRLSLIDHFFTPQTGQQDFWQGNYAELGDFINQPYNYQIKKNSGKNGRKIVIDLERSGRVWKDNVNYPLLLKKSLTIAADSGGMEIQYQISNQSDQELEICFGSEFNIAPAYPDGTYWQTPEGAGSLYDPVSVAAQKEVKFIISYIKLNLNFTFDRAANLWSMPLYTVSQAEDGYERIYQGQIWLFFWKIRIPGGGRWEVKVQQGIS